MKRFKTLRMALALTMVTTSLQVQAEEKNKMIDESDDWSLWETKVNNSEVCYIQSGGENDWYVVLTKVKNAPKSPVEVMIQTVTNVRKSTGIIGSISGVGSTMAFPDLNGKKTHYLGFPKNLSAFIQVMKSENEEVKLRGVGGKKDENVDVSTRGFNDMIRKFEERCNSGQPIVLPEFETNFVNGLNDNIDPRLVDQTKSSLARSIYFGAYPVAVDIVAAKNELSMVLAKYQPLIDELNQNKVDASRLQNTEIPAARNELSKTQQSQTSLRAEIARIQATIPGLKAKVDTAQKAYDQVKAVLAPLEPEYNRLTGNLSSAESRLDQAEKRLSYIDSRLRDGAQSIRSLESEASSLEYSLPQKRNNALRARSNYNDAYSRRSNFNPQWERDSRIRNNYEYSNLERNRVDMERRARQADAEAQQIRRERERIQRDLNVCRSQPGNGGGLVPGPNPGDGVAPQPPPDCSHLEAALANANSQVSQKESESRQYNQRVREIDSRMDSIVRQIDRDVRYEYDTLVDNENRARSEMERREADVRSDDNRVAQIRQAEIPRLEREQSSLTSERPTVLNTISQSTQEINNLTRELNNFKSANNWDQKAAQVAAKQAQLDNETSNLNSANNNKFNAEQGLKNALTREAQIKTNIDSLVAQLNALNSRALQLEDGLKGLPAERAVIDTKIANLQADLKSRQTQLLEIFK